MRYIFCSKCKTKKQTQHKRYKKLVSQYSSLDNFKKNYICSQCKKISHIEREVVVEPDKKPDEMHVLKKKILPYVEWLHSNGIHIQHNRTLFYNSLKDLLSSHFISDFTINISENKVRSITLKNIPFVKEYVMEI